MGIFSEMDYAIRLYGERPPQISDTRLQEYQPQELKQIRKPPRLKTYDNQKLADFCHFIAATEEFRKSYRILCYQNKNPKYIPYLRKMETSWCEANYFYQGEWAEGNKHEDIAERINSICFYEGKDYYITKNSFRKSRRSAKNRKTGQMESTLFSLDNIVIDLDMHDKEATFEEIDREIVKLFRVLFREKEKESSALPRFSFAVKTGRGVHLWIRLESFSAKLTNGYRHFVRQIIAELKAILSFEDIKLDIDEAASINPAGVVRLPYTSNSKRPGYETQLHVFYEESPYRYTYQELSEMYPISKPVRQEKQNAKDPNLLEEKTKSHSHDTGSLTGKRVKFLEWLIEDRGGWCEGYRDLMLHHYYNALVQITDRSTAQEKLSNLNQKFTSPLSEKDIQYNIVKPIDKKGFYKYTNQRFLTDIGANSKERQHFEEKNQKQLEREAARQKKADRNAQIRLLAENGYTREEISKKANCSVKTVTAVLNTGKPTKAERDANILKLYTEGMSILKIAETLSISRNTVKSVLSKNAASGYGSKTS